MAAFFCASFNVVQQNNEYELKAAFIYSFTKYLEMNNDNPTFVIGVLGNSPIIESLENYAVNKKINNKKIEVVKLLHISDIKNCQILFIPETVGSSTIKEFLESENSKNVLVISEKKGALNLGIAINLLLIENKIKFEISQEALSKNNIKASSQLLKLAVNNKH
ncbi:MAG TPA: YfiR family protein [Bacteroidia bacterium]|nr:YfiR family protein [Bacteroidia bacterium]